MSHTWRKASIAPISRKGQKGNTGSCQLVSLTSLCGKHMKGVLLKHISEHMEKLVGNCQHGPTKGKPCLTNLTALCDEMTGSEDKGRAADIIYLIFSKAFNTVSHNMLASKLGRYGFNGCTS